MTYPSNEHIYKEQNKHVKIDGFIHTTDHSKQSVK